MQYLYTFSNFLGRYASAQIRLTPDTLLAKNYLKIHYYAEGKSEIKSGKL